MKLLAKFAVTALVTLEALKLKAIELGSIDAAVSYFSSLGKVLSPVAQNAVGTKSLVTSVNLGMRKAKKATTEVAC